MIRVEIANEQKHVKVDRRRLKAAVRGVLEYEGFERGEISLAVVDDARIAELHGAYLDDPTPTDVLSFPLETTGGFLEGEIVVSAQTAAGAAPRYGWSAEDELLLYAIHGTLHLAGFDDTTPTARAAMRRRERLHLSRLGLSRRGRAGGGAARGASRGKKTP